MRALSKTLDFLITEYPESENLIKPFGNFLLCQEELIKELQEADFPRADNSTKLPLDFKKYPFTHKENLFFLNPLIKTLKGSFPHYKEEIKHLEKPLKLKAFYTLYEKYFLNSKDIKLSQSEKSVEANTKLIKDYLTSLTKGEKAALPPALYKEKEQELASLIGLLLLKLKQIILSYLVSAISDVDAKDTTTCPYCAGKPSTSVIHKKDNSRDLLCADCGRLWRYSRAACAHCSADDQNNLEMVYIDDKSNERAIFCEKCNHYIIEVDIRDRDMPLQHVSAFTLALTYLDILMLKRKAEQI